MSKKIVGYVLLVVGIILVVISIGADVLGIGSVAGFGWKQILGTIVGVIAAIIGIWLAFGKPAKNQ